MTASLWMKSRKFDLAFFQLSGIVFLLFLIPYLAFGDSVVFPIYNFYLVFFGLPHNYLTWATIFPKQSQQSFNMQPVIAAIGICAVLSILIPITRGISLNDWILSFISYYSLWHAYRQHHGICKIYDSIQAKRFQDPTIFDDRKILNLFFGLASFSVVVWAFTHERIDYLLSSDEKYQLIYPVIPMNLFYAYCAITSFVGVWAVKKSVFDRAAKKKFIPYPQLVLMFIALLTYIVPYLFIPITAMPLAVAIATMYHNVQYFGFIWLFENSRGKEIEKAASGEEFKSYPLKLAAGGRWKTYFALAFIYSLLIVVFYKITPSQVGLTFIYFLGISHYIVDGIIWKRTNNKHVSVMISALTHRSSEDQKYVKTSLSGI